MILNAENRNEKSTNNIVEQLCYLMWADAALFNSIKSASSFDIFDIFERNKELITVFHEFFSDLKQNILNIPNSLIDEALKIWNNLMLKYKNSYYHIPARIYEQFLSSNCQRLRKQQGSYYTPEDMVKHMVSQSFEKYLNSSKNNLFEEFKVIDPSCGGASFLIEVMLYLLSLKMPLEKAVDSVFGVDKDRGAVNVSIFTLTIITLSKFKEKGKHKRISDIKKHWQKNIILGDSLKIFNNDQKFNLIIGNPPYVTNKSIPSDDKKYYKTYFNSAVEQFDLSVLFLELGINLLEENGILCYITSNKFMASDYGKPIREIMLKYTSVTDICDVSTLNSFENTSAYPVILFLTKKTPDKNFKINIVNVTETDNMFDNLSKVNQQKIPYNFFINSNNYLMTTAINSDVLPIIEKIKNNKSGVHPSIIKCGLAKSGFGKKISKHKKMNTVPIIQSGNIINYRVIGHNYIEDKYIQEMGIRIVETTRLLLPGIGKRITAAIDRSKAVLGRLYFIEEKDYPNLFYLLMIFNSELLNFYYRIMYWPVHLQGGYLRFNSTYLANLPIPEAADESLNNQNNRHQFVRGISEIGRIVSSENNPNAVIDLKCQAESYIFQLYGVNVKEAQIILNYNEIPEALSLKIINYMVKMS